MKRSLPIVLSALFCFGFIALGTPDAAEKFPVKPMEFIVPLEAGSDGDVIARPVMQKVSQLLGQPVMIVNKPGAGSSIGYREVHRAKPDGYTTGWGSATLISNKLQGISPLDYHDFTMLGTFATYFPVIVAATNTKRPFKTIQEVISYGKAHPGEISISTSNIGGNWWVASMAFMKGTGVEINIIPQPGAGALSMAQVAGGHTDLACVGLGSAKALLDSGQVRLLVNLGEERAAAPYDKIPTMKELGFDVGYESTNFAMGPPRMPKDVVEILVKAIKQAVHEPDYVKFCSERNARWVYTPPEKMVSVFDMRREIVREIMSKAGFLKEAK
ncbi:MAG: tripartite tricarboxylate transporter substrate binding protein [Deltaproteobacteria bacterium]|nr:tripartite tricarboxylate transporter substrate binding protein [Deltaproteobacteria bacterium]